MQIEKLFDGYAAGRGTMTGPGHAHMNALRAELWVHRSKALRRRLDMAMLLGREVRVAMKLIVTCARPHCARSQKDLKKSADDVGGGAAGLAFAAMLGQVGQQRIHVRYVGPVNQVAAPWLAADQA